MKFDQRTFGQRIRVLRQRCGLTQAQMATALHINIDHLGRIELGKRGVSSKRRSSISSEVNERFHALFGFAAGPPFTAEVLL